MSPRASEASSRGFTLLEACVAVIASALLIAGLSRLFTDSHRAYDLQEKVAERDQNGQWVLKHLEDRLREAGAFLPDTGVPLIVPGATLKVAVNPRGGVQPVYDAVAARPFVVVDDAEAFREATHLLAMPPSGGAPELVAIATGHTGSGWVKGLKEGTEGQDTVRLAEPRALAPGEVLYAYALRDYALLDGRLTLRGLVLAENLEEVSVDFLDALGNPTADWDAMRSARLKVVARTADPDPSRGADAFRRAVLSSEVRLRNRP